MQCFACLYELKGYFMADDVTAPAQLPYTEADINSAHKKQLKKFYGQGNIRFTAAEQYVLDNAILPEKPVVIDN